MGLRRKPGEVVQEGQQFDIRGTVEEFKHSVNMYMFWKPGMELFVSHIRRKQIPSYVLPEGYKRSRHPRPTSQQQQSDKESCERGNAGSGDKCIKRKRDTDSVGQVTPEKRQSISPQRLNSFSPNGVTPVTLNSGVGCNMEAVEPADGKVPFREVSEVDNASNSSGVTSMTSEVGSCEDVGNDSVAGSSEENNGSVDGSVEGSNNPGSSQSDSCDADSKNGFQNAGRVFQLGFQEELEVLDLSSLSPSL